MSILVDGYNVLFALGMIPAEVKPGDLQNARQALLHLLADGLGERAKRCTVVFDATRSPPRTPGDLTYRGIEVRFTKRREEADDLITGLIKQCSVPKQLTVISSDHQLVESARRRKAASIKADHFLEWLEQQKQPTQPPAQSPQADPAEREAWLNEFGHLDEEFRDSRHYPELDWQREFKNKDPDE
jgi:predicted RNA-binding protein with PIN domain